MAAPQKSINFYELLDVDRDASAKTIRGSYRSLMQVHHPDHGGDSATAALLNQAYAILCDAELRADYDAHLAEAQLPKRACAFCRASHNYGKFLVASAVCATCDSPLFPADRQRLELRGQRAIARIDKQQDILFYTRWPQAIAHAAVTEDISLNGMRFVSKARVSAGQYIKIVSDIAEAIAQVSNVRRRRRGINVLHVAGVAFVTLQFNKTPGGFVSERI